MKNKYDISVIVPFYNGNRYMKQLYDFIEKNTINSNLKIELILVNDSPSISVIMPKKHTFDIHIILNKQNSGIHFSRVQGIKYAQGEYILMLDQDDILLENAFISQYNRIGDNDMIVSNGIDENPISKGDIYRSNNHQKKVLNEKYYYFQGNMIVSPGQCLIKKSAIPCLWMEDTMKINGCDDLMLWIIMFHEKKMMAINDEKIYVHTYNGENVSADFLNMKQSSIEMMTYLKKNDIIKKENEKIYMKRLNMREIYEGKNFFYKILASIRYPKLAIELFKLNKM